ncbi:2-phosphosulfolactate phosphatase [Agromyces bauzanensis]
MSDSTAPLGQAKYQVRFDWGAPGARRIVPGAHVVVLVDALTFTTDVVRAAEQGDETPVATGASVGADDATRLVSAALAGGDHVVVLAASLRNRTATAERILGLQEERGERMIVAIVAAGETTDCGIRFAIEDQLTAGAVIDALIGLGIDHISPEAAVASAAFEGLKQAAVHLIGAAGTGAELTAAGRRADVRAATERDVARAVPELRDGVFRAA